MPERDWAKDWEKCQKAPGGLWSRVRQLGWDYWTIGVIENHQARLFRDEEAERAWDFIEAAREGWPAALEERARLEARVKELEEMLIGGRRSCGGKQDA